MAKNSEKAILVYADWKGMEKPQLMGTLNTELVGGKEVFSFSYSREWLKSDYAQLIDPNLHLYEGPQFPSEGKENFGIFLDSSPDRYGRMLMRRREAAIARKEERPEKKLLETDYLLGVYDNQRMGALRFKLETNGLFLSNDSRLATPPWTTLRELERISLKLEEQDVVEDPDYLKWINILIKPGASLGGARPKVGVMDNDNQLWIAKFPSLNDDQDIGGWEAVTQEMALMAGINMTISKAIKFSSDHHTFLTKRFDRNENGKRIHFVSAMTLLEYSDGDNHMEGISYLELAEFISMNGAKVHEDLKELWRRIVFSICVSNTDDHLRNHGFLLTAEGWRLSPAYDINPVEHGNGLMLNINESENDLNLELALSVIDYFRLKEDEAIKIIHKTIEAVKQWKSLAIKYAISKREQEIKAIAFSRAKITI